MFGLKSNEKEWILSHIEIDIGTSKLVSLSPDHLQRIIIIWQFEPQSQRFPVLNSTASQKWPQNNHHLCVVACCWATCRPGISIVAFSFDHIVTGPIQTKYYQEDTHTNGSMLPLSKSPTSSYQFWAQLDFKYQLFGIYTTNKDICTNSWKCIPPIKRFLLCHNKNCSPELWHQ